MALNGGYGALQIYMAWREAHSLALFTDALHNLSDVVSIALPWMAIILAAKALTADGERVKNMAAFLNFAMLLGFMIWAIVEAVRRLDNPPEVSGEIMTAMGAVGIVINFFSAWLLRRGGEHDQNLRAAYLHQAADLMSSVAVVIAGVITIRTGWQATDAVVTLLVSTLIARMAWTGLWETGRLLKAASRSTSVDVIALKIEGAADDRHAGHVH